MSVYNDGLNNLFHTEGSRVVWSTTSRRPALLLPNQRITVNPFTVQFPDFAKSNAMGFASSTSGGFQATTCLSMITINPQEWDSGLSLLATIPAQCNYFETEVTLTRTKAPSNFMKAPIPDCWASGSTHMCDGGALLEATGPIVRIFRIERSGNGIYLRRKQSVRNAGPRFSWAGGNDNTNPNTGGMSNGWTYAGDPNAWLASERDYRTGGSIYKRRGEANQCTLTDNTDYSSIWTGTMVITPGYIKL